MKDPEKRLTAAQALKHPWFSDAPKPMRMAAVGGGTLGSASGCAPVNFRASAGSRSSASLLHAAQAQEEPNTPLPVPVAAEHG